MVCFVAPQSLDTLATIFVCRGIVGVEHCIVVMLAC